MPYFYHISRGIQQNSLDNGFIKGEALFFSKKDSFWYKVERQIGMNHFGGYKIYEIFIPSTAYTTSFNPRTPKIVKITKNTLKEYIKKYQSLGNYGVMIELQKRGLIGVDCTDFKTNMSPEEGFIWEMPLGATIQLIETKSNVLL
jgi:hypothetical protein